MTPEKWETIKSIFLRLGDGDLASPTALLADQDEDVAEMVKLLLAQDSDSLPSLRHPCWSDPESDAPFPFTFSLGQTLEARFEITTFLGRGGFGEVFRAFDQHQQIFVAIKTLRSELTSDRNALVMLRNELNVSRLITHRNVCRVFDIHWPTNGQSSTPVFFTMELLEGETLANYLQRTGPLAVETAESIVDQILDGLEAAHTKGVVHRDLKSANIMLSDGGRRPVIMDFGLAREIKPLGDIESTLAANQFAGTPAYMAPEQLRGHVATITSDIHALGVILFEIMTGRKPFEGTTPLEVAANRLNGSAPSPRKYTAGIRSSWEYTIQKCLEGDADKRPSSAKMVRDLLRSTPPLFWCHRRIFVLGAVAAIAGTASARVDKTTRSEAVTLELGDLENNTGEIGLNYLCSGTTGELSRRLAQLSRIRVIRLHRPLLGSASYQPGLVAFGGYITKSGSSIAWNLRAAEQGRVVWSEVILQKSEDQLLAVQSRIADELNSVLKRYQATPVSQESQTYSPTTNGLALDYYTRARYLLEGGSSSNVRAAMPYLDKALQEDPRFALGWAAVAEANLLLMAYITGDSEGLLNVGRNAALQAVYVDPTLPEAHAALAAVKQQLLDWPGSEASYQEALRLKPWFPRAHRWYAGFVLQFGRFQEATEHGTISLKQDPYDRMGPLAIGLYLLFSGDPIKAISVMESAVRTFSVEATHHNLGQAYARMSQLTSGSEGRAWLRKAFDQAEIVTSMERNTNSQRPLLSDRMFSLFYAISSDRRAAQPYVERLTEDVDLGKCSPADLAAGPAIMHNYSAALDLLERGYYEAPRSLLYSKVNPFLENLRGQPRYEQLIKNLKL